MKTAINALIASAGSATAAFAANGPQSEEPGILVWAFMGFCAVIVVGQLVPSIMLVVGAVKGLLGSPKEVKGH